jgi:hypothetical protein
MVALVNVRGITFVLLELYLISLSLIGNVSVSFIGNGNTNFPLTSICHIKLKEEILTIFNLWVKIIGLFPKHCILNICEVYA